jgi:hypothetical protein
VVEFRFDMQPSAPNDVTSCIPPSSRRGVCWDAQMSWWRRSKGVPEQSDVAKVQPPLPDVDPPRDLAALGSGRAPVTHVLGITGSGVEVRAFYAPAGDVVGWWHRLRAEHASSGLWPVLLGPELGDLAAALTPESRDNYDDAAELRRAEAMSLEDLTTLRETRNGSGPDLFAHLEVGFDRPPGVVHRHPPTFSCSSDDGLVALVPAAHGWQVPVILGWEGGCNYEMEPVDHGVVLRDWHERFGVELVGLSTDQVLEVLVRRPPTDPAEAVAAARELYLYCPDLVDQCVGALTALAQDQVGSESWQLWWD